MRLLLLLLTLLSATINYAQDKDLNKPMVISYYAGSAQRLDSFDAREMTHIIYCFGHLKGNCFHLESNKDTLLIQKMVGMKQKNPQLKVLLSLGGWGGCATCSDAFSTETGRIEFARSVKETSNFLGADGIDLDWEYPVIEGYPGHAFKPEDKEHFSLLVKALRDELGQQAVISFAAGGFQQFIDQAVDWNAVMPLVDFVNMMTYDLVNGYATTTGHHTPLYSTPKQKESADNAIAQLIDKGVAPEKIVIGAAFYSRVWEKVPPQNNGLYQPGVFKTAIAFRQFPQEMKGFKIFWDSTAKAPYAYNKAKGLFATFDDKRSIAAKTQYVLQHRLGGIMYWELASDLASNGLLHAINNTLDKALKNK